MGDKRLNDLLRWSIEHTDTTQTQSPDSNENPPAPPPSSNLTPEIMAALMGGPSDADLMRASLEITADPSVTLENKLIAFDNFEQLIENLDNANNIANLGLWTPLLAHLADPEPEIRRMAAWCVGTAVQNNERTQERLFAVGGLPPLVGLAMGDAARGGEEQEPEPESVRRKAVYALSSAVRNYQPAMDVFVEELGRRGVEVGKVDAEDMAQVDVIMEDLRERAKAASS